MKFWAVSLSYNPQPCGEKRWINDFFLALADVTNRNVHQRSALTPLLHSWVKTSLQSFCFFLFSKNCHFDRIHTFCANCSLSTHRLHLGVSNSFCFHRAEMCPPASGLIFTYLCINNTSCSGFIMHNSDFFFKASFFSWRIS